MKSMARAILFTGFVAATTAAVGDKLSSAIGETDQPTESNLQADPQASNPMMSTEAAVSTEGAATLTNEELIASDAMTVTPSPSTEIIAANPPLAESVPPAPRPAEPVARRAPVRAAYVVTYASAFPVQVDEAGYRVTARTTFADLRGNDRVMTAESAFPRGVDEAGYQLVAKTTFADLNLGSATRVAQAERRSADLSSGT